MAAAVPSGGGGTRGVASQPPQETLFSNAHSLATKVATYAKENWPTLVLAAAATIVGAILFPSSILGVLGAVGLGTLSAACSFSLSHFSCIDSLFDEYSKEFGGIDLKTKVILAAAAILLLPTWIFPLGGGFALGRFAYISR